MSVTVCWRQVSKKPPKHFHGGNSLSLACLESVFGKTITENDVGKLRAMAQAANDKFYNEVADLVGEVGDIEIWGEW